MFERLFSGRVVVELHLELSLASIAADLQSQRGIPHLSHQLLRFGDALCRIAGYRRRGFSINCGALSQDHQLRIVRSLPEPVGANVERHGLIRKVLPAVLGAQFHQHAPGEAWIVAILALEHAGTQFNPASPR